MADDPLAPSSSEDDALRRTMTHEGPDPRDVELQRRLAAVAQNFDQQIAPVRRYGQALNAAATGNNLDALNQLQPLDALATAWWGTGGQMPMVRSFEGLRMSPELLAHARRQAEANFKYGRDEDLWAVVNHASQVENYAPHEEYYSAYLDHLENLWREHERSRPRDPFAQFDPELQQQPWTTEDALGIGGSRPFWEMMKGVQMPPVRATRPEVLDKLIAHGDFEPQLREGKMWFRSLSPAENEELNRIGWGRAPDVTFEEETSSQTARSAWEKNIRYWRELVGRGQ